jgi:hypothetical protein
MSCSCQNTPQPPQPPQPSFLDIVSGNSVTPPNGTYQMNLQAVIGDQVYKGTGLLTYSTNSDGSIDHYFQSNFEGSNPPFIPPITGKGFLNKYEYQSHNNSHHIIHSFITNKLNITDKEITYHINAQPSSCCCNGNSSCCQSALFSFNACSSCNSCNGQGKCCA